LQGQTSNGLARNQSNTSRGQFVTARPPLPGSTGLIKPDAECGGHFGVDFDQMLRSGVGAGMHIIGILAEGDDAFLLQAVVFGGDQWVHWHNPSGNVTMTSGN